MLVEELILWCDRMCNTSFTRSFRHLLLYISQGLLSQDRVVVVPFPVCSAWQTSSALLSCRHPYAQYAILPCLSTSTLSLPCKPSNSYCDMYISYTYPMPCGCGKVDIRETRRWLEDRPNDHNKEVCERVELKNSAIKKSFLYAQSPLRLL